MQRFITYIYAYSNGQKSGNAGYAKIETKGMNGRMEIHLLGTEVLKGEGEVFFLSSKGEQLEYYKAGTFAIEDGAGIFKVDFQIMDVLESGLELEQLVGIAIKDSHGTGYLSFWKDIMQTEFSERFFVDGKKTIKIEEEREEELLHTMEIPVRNIFPKVNLSEIWQGMQKNRLSVQINESVCAIQIELKDLRELPKQYWYLGNNSFLLHGFFNYRYLLLGKLPDERWFLGVPGVYQKQERVMAAIFGFPGFIAAGELREKWMEGLEEEKGAVAAAEENIRELQPGAWYHVLED